MANLDLITIGGNDSAASNYVSAYFVQAVNNAFFYSPAFAVILGTEYHSQTNDVNNQDFKLQFTLNEAQTAAFQGGNARIAVYNQQQDGQLIITNNGPPSSGGANPIANPTITQTIFNTIGPTGATGATGPAGAAGTDGATGPAGPTGPSGNLVVSGTLGDDSSQGGAGNDIIYGNLGNDTLNGGAGDDTAYGGQGNDSVLGGSGDDVLYGNMGADIVYGNRGSDIVYGNQGNDVLYGGQGDDVLYGGMGDDILVGGLGSNILVGGVGADRYVFAADPGARDLVLGFNQSEGDRLSLGGQTYTTSTAQNGDALLTLSGGGTIDLAGIKADQVNASYFAA